MYTQELNAIKRANRFRERRCYDENLIDLASNDYLGFAEEKSLFDAAVSEVSRYRYHAPRASQLVNGYHPLHEAFEKYVTVLNGFEAGIVVGSGFLANLSLIEALPRKKDLLVLDEAYHASGVLAAKLPPAQVRFFKHNDPDDLERILTQEVYQRAIVAVEGVYSMEGDLLDRAIFDVADRHAALLIVDEAHSAGVLGERLLGIFDYYGITPDFNHIKIGTLGKALGSYGAYILASKEIVTFLQNRAKAIIYATAPSVFDIALAHKALEQTQQQASKLREAIDIRTKLASDFFAISLASPILTIPVNDSKRALFLQQKALDAGFVIGAIRPPTVERAILRIILRANVPLEKVKALFMLLKENGV